MPPSLAFGSVVRMMLLDPQGRNPKPRPAVVITTDAELQEGCADVWLVAITGEGGHEPQFEIPLAYDPAGKCRTGLRKPSVAVCCWLAKVPIDAIERRVGHLDAATMAAISMRVERYRAALANPHSSP